MQSIIWTAGGRIQFSPDHESLMVETQRGILETNESEATIWIFHTRQTLNFLRSSAESSPPQPRALLRIRGVLPSKGDVISTTTVISSLRWTPAGDRVAFIACGANSERHLYVADLATGSRHQITPDGEDVSQYEFVGETVLYRVKPSIRPISAPNIVVGTNTSLNSLIAQRTGEADFSNLSEFVHVIRNGKSTVVADSSDGKPIQCPPHSYMSLSPDGKTLMVLRAISYIPKSWEAYRPWGNPALKLRAGVVGTDAFAMPMELVSIDLETGRLTKPVDAPSGVTSGYSTSSPLVIWSRDGAQALLMDVLLPLSGTDGAESENRTRSAAIVLYDTRLSKWTFVAWQKESRIGADPRWKLDRVDWREDENRIGLSYETEDKRVITQEEYALRGGKWTITDQHLPGSGSFSKESELLLKVFVREDLNTPPILTACDASSGTSRDIWDPNPQLRKLALGQASIFHWIARDGVGWQGGLVKPPDYEAGKRYPLVIQTHGFNESTFLGDGVYPTAMAAREMAAIGIMVLQAMPLSVPDLSTPLEPTHQEAGYSAAIDKLVAEGLVDRRRIGIIGFSRTCYHVLCAITDSPDSYAAATIADGVNYGYGQYLLTADQYGMAVDYENNVGARPVGAGLNAWLQHCPTFHLDRIMAPLRIEAHDTFSLLSQWEVYAGLKAQRKPVDLVQLPYASHVVGRPVERMESQQGDVDWFRFWLKGEEDCDPAKAEQYARWRHLRELHEADLKKYHEEQHAAPAA